MLNHSCDSLRWVGWIREPRLLRSQPVSKNVHVFHHSTFPCSTCTVRLITVNSTLDQSIRKVNGCTSKTSKDWERKEQQVIHHTFQCRVPQVPAEKVTDPRKWMGKQKWLNQATPTLWNQEKIYFLVWRVRTCNWVQHTSKTEKY